MTRRSFFALSLLPFLPMPTKRARLVWKWLPDEYPTSIVQEMIGLGILRGEKIDG